MSKRSCWAIFLLFAVPFSAWGQAGAPKDLFSPPSGAMWLLPGAGYSTQGKFYGPTSPNANWVIGQWNTPENLPPFQNGETRNDYLHVKLEPDRSYLLEQNGKDLSCDRTYASGVKDVHEFDLFASPNNRNRPEYPQAERGVDATLGSITHLYHKITAEPLSIDVLNTDCQLTRTIFVTSVTLRDQQMKQTLFYQLRLGMVQANGDRIVDRLPPPFWFAKGNDVRTGHTGAYGYDDSITSYGDPPVQVGHVSTYTLDLLPRLVAIIREGDAYGVDQDLSHWTVRGTYHGEVIWGHIHVSSRWSGFSLAVQ